MNINLPGFKKGSPLTIMQTSSKRIRNEEGKFTEILSLVYKDRKTGLKHKVEMEDPMYSFYLAKEDKRVNYNRIFIPMKDTEEYFVKHKELDKEVAKALGLKKWFMDCIQSGNRQEIRRIHTHPDVFMSDVNIEDYYRFWFDVNYDNQVCPIGKAYFDIEADTIDMAGDFPEMGECPVNAITLVYEPTMQVYTFLLRDKRNPQMVEFETFVAKYGTKELHDFVVNHVSNGRKYEKNVTLGVERFNYNFLFYNEANEIDLISDFFLLINKLQPDFALAWNQAFDIPYLIARCRALGYNPAYIMSHDDFQYKFADYFIDERVLNEFEERCDFASISSYTVYLDQMIQYASRRKGQTKSVSYTLDYIGEMVAGVGKLDYKEITTNIAELPRKDYKKFVYYNVIDVITQFCIESIVEDIDYVFGKSLVNNTRYSKVHRQTVYLKNRGMKEFYEKGLIIGNNVNKFNDPPKEKFMGAFVADPLKVSKRSKVRLNGHPVNLFDNCIDFD